MRSTKRRTDRPEKLGFKERKMADTVKEMSCISTGLQVDLFFVFLLYIQIILFFPPHGEHG